MSKSTTSKGDLIFISNQYYTNLRFVQSNLNNLFKELSNSFKPITTFLSLFPTWTFMDNPFYFNLTKNKNKGLAKRKITFGQTLT